MIASESVLLPEPFGPMIAWTDPLSTARSMPFRMGLPSTLTSRSRISRLDNGPLPRGGLRELGEGHAVERLRDRRLELEPHRAALPVHQTGPAERRDELLEIGLRQVLALRDGVQRDRSLAPVPREIDHEAHPVLAPSGHMESRRRKGISEHFTRNCRRPFAQ